MWSEDGQLLIGNIGRIGGSWSAYASQDTPPRPSALQPLDTLVPNWLWGLAIRTRTAGDLHQAFLTEVSSLYRFSNFVPLRKLLPESLSLVPILRRSEQHFPAIGEQSVMDRA